VIALATAAHNEYKFMSVVCRFTSKGSADTTRRGGYERNSFSQSRKAVMSDAPCARQRDAWFQSDQSVSSSKCARRTGLINGKTATVEIRNRVATENHQVRVALVDPEPRRADPPRL
jgi:hypothetical protein